MTDHRRYAQNSPCCMKRYRRGHAWVRIPFRPELFSGFDFRAAKVVDTELQRSIMSSYLSSWSKYIILHIIYYLKAGNNMRKTRNNTAQAAYHYHLFILSKRTCDKMSELSIYVQFLSCHFL